MIIGGLAVFLASDASSCLPLILQYTNWIAGETTNIEESSVTEKTIEILQDATNIYLNSLDNQTVDTLQIWDFSGRFFIMIGSGIGQNLQIRFSTS